MSARRMAGDSLKGLIKPGGPDVPTGEATPRGSEYVTSWLLKCIRKSKKERNSSEGEEGVLFKCF